MRTEKLEASMSVSIAEMILAGTELLRAAGVPEARREASGLVAHVIGQDRTFIIAHSDEKISAAQFETLQAYLDRRARGEPLQYITGHQEFFGLDFEVTKDVLIPRPETELLVETALRLIAGPDEPALICDVGTGSGCVAIALLHERPLLRAVAVDLSNAAIQVARRNARHYSLDDRIAFIVSDSLAAVDAGPTFDLIVSNPPYVSEDALAGLQREVRDYEPRVALTPGVDGLAIIRRLLSEAGNFLKPGGHLLIEIGFDQGAAVEGLIDRNVWQLLDIHADLQGIPRTVALRKRREDLGD